VSSRSLVPLEREAVWRSYIEDTAWWRVRHNTANIGRKGGEMRAKTLSAEHHSEIARKTATSKAKVPLVPVEGE